MPGHAARSASAVAATARSSAYPALDPMLRRFLCWTVAFITCGYIFLDYWSYSRTDHGGDGEWERLLAGQGAAPNQYRIGVLRIAASLAALTHTQLRHTFALIDFVCVGISIVLLLCVLVRMDAFRTASRIGRWLQATLALGCILLYLPWSLWYQKPETHATLLLLLLSAIIARWREQIPATLALVALAALGATVRADAMVALHAGLLLVCLLPQARTLPLGRTTQAVASALAMLAAVAVQYGIMHGIYPNAQREAAAFQLISNLKAPDDTLVLACALFPWWWTLRLAAKRWTHLDGWTIGLLAGSLVHFALFYTLGMASEVRIFLPYAMTLVPVTVTLLHRSLEQSESSAADVSLD